MASRALIVLTEGLDGTQRALVQQAIKDHAKKWWHEFLDAWIVITDDDVLVWRDRLKLITALPGGKLLVLRLPEVGARIWAGSASAKTLEWLPGNLNVEPDEESDASEEVGFADEPPF
ncbi:hypothetical protein AB0C38_23495 [Amycolatopsis sp. NPDC048633]|uniref:hypothetical protein n=1 Tax=Amycolatopsis sp. NPDC048633 TaxID=3157095 RepID=UPI0033D9AB6E